MLGHNSKNSEVQASVLKRLVGSIERLESDKAEIAEQIKASYGEAKALGYDVKIMRTVIARRRKDADALSETDALIATYEQALSGG